MKHGVEGSEYVLTRKNVTFFYSKLLLDNSANFTSRRMKVLSKKIKMVDFYECLVCNNDVA